MEDRFKFRAWDGEEKTMISMYHLEQMFLGYYLSSVFNSPHLEVMQCTGLKDKNGKLIYEGDYCEDEDGCFFFVEWCQDRTCYTIRYLHNGGYEDLESYVVEDSEVISNIYESPELLEGK